MKLTQYKIFFLFLLMPRLIFAALPLPKALIPLTSQQGQKIFGETVIKGDFFNLIPYVVTQKKLSYCGVASSVISLNSLGLPAPQLKQLKPYHLFTQDNIFANQLGKIKIKQSQVAKRGMFLKELYQLLVNSGAKAKLVYANNINEKNFINTIKAALKNTDQVVLVNYDRKKLALPGGGHISPIAAYDPKTDRFLLLEVSRYKYPPFWVESHSLWLASHTFDGKQSRGIVIVSH